MLPNLYLVLREISRKSGCSSAHTWSGVQISSTQSASTIEVIIIEMLPYKFNHRAVPEVAAQKTRALGRGDDFDRLCFARSQITSSS